MNWYYADGNKQAGPITEEALDELVRSGRLRPETLVWRAGLVNWQPYHQARPDSPVAAVSTPVSAVAAPAGAEPAPEAAPVAASEPVWYFEDGCKPAGPFTEEEFQQAALSGRIRPETRVWRAGMPDWRPWSELAGAPGGSATPAESILPAHPGALTQLLRERDYDLSIPACVDRSWALLLKNFFPMVTAVFVVMLASVVLQLAVDKGQRLLADRVPWWLLMVAALVIVSLSGPLFGGLYYYFLRLIRGQETEMADCLAGFRLRAVQLMLSALVSGALLAAVWTLVELLVGLVLGPVMPPLLLRAAIWLFALPPIIYLSVAWLYSVPLIVDRGYDFWTALWVSRRVVAQHWWLHFGLGLLAAFICFVGLILCFLPLLVAMPLAFGMIAWAYDDVLGRGRALRR